MKEKSFQHVISYSDTEFCIEGTWITNCTNSIKSINNPDEELIRSPPIFFQSYTFYLSFYFDTNHELFMIYIDMEDVPSPTFPVSIKLTMRNHHPKNILNFQSEFCFTPQTKHAIASFNQITSLEVFSDEGFSFDGFFIIQYSFIHKEKSPSQPLKFCLPSQSMSLTQRALMLYPNPINFYNPLSIKNNCQYAGLCNQGATCYLNSVLQALFHIPAFRSLVFQIPLTDSNPKSNQLIKKTMIYNLQKLFAQMKNSNSAISTKDLTISFGWTSAESFKQNDAQELLRVFLESLERKLKDKIKNSNQTITIDNNNNNGNNNDNTNKNEHDNRNDNKNSNTKSNDNNFENSISDLFKFQVLQTIECPNVSFRNTRVDDYLDLTVEVRGCQNLYQSLKKFTSPEKLDSPYSTEEFGPQQAVMYNKFKTLPKVLFIHLKRFEYRPPGITDRIASKISPNLFPSNQLTKINDRFEFPIVIDLSEFVDKTNDNDKKDWIYELFGVLVHSGSASFGHYYAYLRPEESPRWYKFNDSFVNECSESEAVNDNYGDGSNCASGYMLIYMRRKDLPQLFTETVQPPKELLIEEKKEEIKLEKNKLIEKKDDITSNFLNDTLFYDSNITNNLIEVKIITDQNLRDGCDECSLSISNINNDGYYRGKCAPFIFHDSGVILMHYEATESELLDKVSSFFHTRENAEEESSNLMDEDDTFPFFENSIKAPKIQPKNNEHKFDLYMMNLNRSDGTVSRKITPTEDRISYFGKKNIYVFYRSPETKKESIGLNIDNYLLNEKDDIEDQEKEEKDTKVNQEESPYYPYLDIDNHAERFVKRVLNVSVFLTSSVRSVVDGAKDIIKMNLNWNKNNKNKKKRATEDEAGEKILIFLKVFDYKKQEIRFLKTKNVYHDDKLSILYEEANEFFFPNGKDDSVDDREHIKFYLKRFSTVYDNAIPEKTFKENKIYNGCIIIMQNIEKDVKIDSNRPSQNSTKSEKTKNLAVKVELPKTSNSLLDYIDTKYNMCDAVVSNYDTPSQFLFILRFSFNCEVLTLKQTVAKAAGIDLYDPSKNSIILYTQHLNSDDEPNSSPLANCTRITSPLNRLFFRFFSDTPESKISLMTPIKVWLNHSELRTVLASKSGTVKEVVQKIVQSDSCQFDEKSCEISLDKSGALLCEIPSSFKIFNVPSNCSIHLSKKNDENELKIAVCHTKGINLFVPFFFIVKEQESFVDTKKRLKEEIQKYTNGNDINFFDSLLITLHHINKSLYDTMMPTQISDNQILFDIVKSDKTCFLFVELPKEKTKNETENKNIAKKNNNVIIID